MEIELCNKLSNLVHDLNVLEDNDYLEDILKKLDSESYVYEQLKDLEDIDNDMAIDYTISECKRMLIGEIISIVKILYQ